MILDVTSSDGTADFAVEQLTDSGRPHFHRGEFCQYKESVQQHEKYCQKQVHDFH